MSVSVCGMKGMGRPAEFGDLVSFGFNQRLIRGGVEQAV
jgi:hypothetical protein